NSWAAHYGESQAEALAKASLQQAPIDVTFLHPEASLEVGRDLGGDTMFPDVNWSMRMADRDGHITSWPEFKAGLWWVQDLAASIPVKCLGDMTDKSILEIGAAPGGKPMQLAAAGARVTALDVSGARMRRRKENLDRVRHGKGEQEVKTVVAE